MTDPNTAHRAAIDTSRLYRPDETSMLLLCTLPGRMGGKATVGDSRLPAATVWHLLDVGFTPDQVHEHYPWCSVEDATVLDQLRRDVANYDTDEGVDA